MTATTQTTLTLNNGVTLPAIGFGVFQAPPDVTQAGSPLGGVSVYGAAGCQPGSAPKDPGVARLAGNLDVVDSTRSADDIAAIDALDTGVRGGPNQDAIDFPRFNRTIPGV